MLDVLKRYITDKSLAAFDSHPPEDAHVIRIKALALSSLLRPTKLMGII